MFDLPGLAEIASCVCRREIRLATVDTQSPSPFWAALLFGHAANYLYEGDAPLAERRAQALAVDQAQLRAPRGGGAAGAHRPPGSGELEVTLQRLDAAHQATSPERLHHLLSASVIFSRDEATPPVGPNPDGDVPAR